MKFEQAFLKTTYQQTHTRGRPHTYDMPFLRRFVLYWNQKCYTWVIVNIVNAAVL